MSEDTNKAKRTALDLINQVNRPFLFLGLRAEVGVIYIVVILLLLIKFWYVGLGLVGITLPVLGRLNKENKKGNPNYLRAVMNFNNLKKYYQDDKGLLKYLNRDHDGEDRPS